jgi:hypothetical protein
MGGSSARCGGSRRPGSAHRGGTRRPRVRPPWPRSNRSHSRTTSRSAGGDRWSSTKPAVSAHLDPWSLARCTKEQRGVRTLASRVWSSGCGASRATCRSGARARRKRRRRFRGPSGRNPGRKSRGSNAISAGSGAFPPRGAPTSRLEAQAVLALLAAFRGERALGLLLVRWLTSSIGASSSGPVRFYFTGPTVQLARLRAPGSAHSKPQGAWPATFRHGRSRSGGEARRGTAAPRLSSSAVTECSGSQRDVADQSGWRRGRFRWEMCRTHGARAVPSPRSACCARRSLAGRSRCCART